MRVRRHWRTTIGILATILAVGSAYWLASRLGVVRPWWWYTLPFDGAGWKASKNWDEDNPRGRMIGSLLHRHRILGMSRAQICELLGPPDGVDDAVAEGMAVPAADVATAREFNYVVGSRSGLFNIDHDIMHIYFDAQGTADRCIIRPS